MSTLIALATGINPSLGDEPRVYIYWNSLLSAFHQPGKLDVAVFLPGILRGVDHYNNEFRRFSIIGQTPEAQISNCFELGFEKGFDRVVVLREDWLEAKTPLIQEVISTPPTIKMSFVPARDGSIGCWAMHRELFWTWPRFDVLEKEIVVEMISLCMEKNINYQLIDNK